MNLMVGELGQGDVREGLDGAARPEGAAELAMGLQLLRASSLTSTRLQLALARRDRRVAMTALDTLAAIDGEIEGLVDRLAGSDAATPELAAIGAWLAQEKNAVTAEKLGLVCDVGGPSVVSPADRLADVAEADERQAAEAYADVALPPHPDADTDAGDEAAPSRRWLKLVLLAVAILVLAAGSLVAVAAARGEALPNLTELGRLIGLR